MTMSHALADVAPTPPALWRRFAAMVYDSLLIIACSMGYGALMLALGQWLYHDAEMLASGRLFQVGWLVVMITFFCFFWMKAGQTLGMRAWRLQITLQNSQQLPSLLPCLMRCLLALPGWLFCWTALFRKDRRCLHDIVSGTQVVLTVKNT